MGNFRNGILFHIWFQPKMLILTNYKILLILFIILISIKKGSNLLECIGRRNKLKMLIRHFKTLMPIVALEEKGLKMLFQGSSWQKLKTGMSLRLRIIKKYQLLKNFLREKNTVQVETIHSAETTSQAVYRQWIQILLKVTTQS